MQLISKFVVHNEDSKKAVSLPEAETNEEELPDLDDLLEQVENLPQDDKLAVEMALNYLK